MKIAQVAILYVLCTPINVCQKVLLAQQDSGKGPLHRLFENQNPFAMTILFGRNTWKTSFKIITLATLEIVAWKEIKENQRNQTRLNVIKRN